MSLCVHDKGSRIATEEEVRNISVPTATRTFQPVRNGELLDMVEKVADTHGLKLANAAFGLAKYGQRMFGTYDLVGQDIGDIASFQLGIRNSCDKSLSAGICFGAKVFVCDNLAFVGYANGEDGISGQVSHKHTPRILHDERLYSRLMASFEKFQSFKEWQINFYDKLRETSVDDNQACGIIVEAARKNAINKTDILEVADEWLWQERGQNEPIEGRIWHPEFKSRTGFSLMNAFTEVGKAFQKKNPVEYPRKTMNLVGFLNQRFQLN